MSIASTVGVNSNPAEQPVFEKGLDEILGVAIFDLNGLPQEYFVTPENNSTRWVQIVFQALGLKSLLMSSLQLDNFQHICICLNQQTAIVVRSKNTYIAVLLSGQQDFPTPEATDQFSHWVRQFEQHTLRQHSRFQAT